MALARGRNKMGVWEVILLSWCLVGPWVAMGEGGSESPPEEGDEGGVSEVLPDPQELRGSQHPSYRPQRGFKYTTKDRRTNNHRPSSTFAQEFLEHDDDFYSMSGSQENDFAHLPQSSSHIDLVASEDGYGHSCSSSYVNASAVALLAFLFLLNLVQDIIQELTAENMMMMMMNRRRSRSKRSPAEEEAEEAMQFVQNGGLGAMKEGLPDIVIPLMIKLSSANESECLLRPICEANAQLALNYGQVGKVFASLLSNIASHAFSNRDTRTFSLAQNAASKGRNEGVCDIYHACRPKMPP